MPETDTPLFKPAGLVVLDVEATHLNGQIFAAAALAYDLTDQIVTRTWTARTEPTETPSEWVQKHVLPAVDDPRTGIPATSPTYADLLTSWRQWWGDYRRTHAILVHCGWPLEARFLLDAHRTHIHTGPYPLLDVAADLWAAGHDPRSVDAYLDHTDALDIVGVPHHPLYDCRVTLEAWRRLRADRARQISRAARGGPLTAWRRRRCPHQDVIAGTTWVDTVHVDHGRKLSQCTYCRQYWAR